VQSQITSPGLTDRLACGTLPSHHIAIMLTYVITLHILKASWQATRNLTMNHNHPIEQAALI
jgi:hypothetical protein